MLKYVVSVVLLAFVPVPILALSVTPGSPCYDICSGAQATTVDDIVCADSEFANSNKGRLLQNCIQCQSTSTYVASRMADQYYFLYHLILVQQLCLSENTLPSFTSCSSTCEQLSNWIGTQSNRYPYAYCSAASNAYQNQAPSCATCLQSRDGSGIIGNFVKAAVGACTSQAQLYRGGLISVTDNLFNTSSVTSGTKTTSSIEVVTTSASRTVSTPGSVVLPAQTTSDENQSQYSSQTYFSSTLAPVAVAATAISTSNVNNSTSVGGSEAAAHSKGLSTGAMIGIGVAVGLLAALVIAGVVLFYLRRKRGTWSRMHDHATSPSPSTARTTPAAKFVAPVAITPKPLSSDKAPTADDAWFYAANPRQSSDLSALPQRDWR